MEVERCKRVDEVASLATYDVPFAANAFLANPLGVKTATQGCLSYSTYGVQTSADNMQSYRSVLQVPRK